MDVVSEAHDSACLLAIAEPIPEAFRLPPLTEATWAERPVVTTPHPVRWEYFGRWHTLMEEQIGSRRPNGALNGLVAEADAHWRLLQATDRGLPRNADDDERWLAGAQAASLLGLNALTAETFARAPGLDALRTALDMLVSPSIEVRGQRGGKVAVRHPVGGKVTRDAEQAGEDLRPDLVQDPHLGFGLGWRLRDEDGSDDDPLVQWGAWVDLGNVGVTNLRAEYDLVNESWSVTARRRIAGDLYVNGSLRSQDESWDPAKWSAGLAVQYPFDRRWTIRVDRTEGFGRGEVRWVLSVRAELGAWLPGRLDPPLAPWPAAAPVGPNQLAPDAIGRVGI